MVDRVSSSDSKVPDFSTKKEQDRVIGQIELMEPSTAYVALQGVVVPALNSLHNNRSLLNATLPPPPMYAPSKASASASASSISRAERSYQILKELQENFANIQKQLTDLYANRQEIIDRWMESTEANPIRHDDQVLNNFRDARKRIERNLDKIKNGITEFANQMPPSRDKEDLIRQLRKIHSDLVSKIPEPGSTSYDSTQSSWKIIGDTIVDMKNYGDSFIRFLQEKSIRKQVGSEWKEVGTGKVEAMQWGSFQNPLGIFEMVINANRSKYDDFLATLSEGRKSINKFYRTDGAETLHLFALRDLDVQSAYMYLITVYLPFLQNESMKALEEQGEAMKQVSKVYDKWNEIQSDIGNLSKNVRILEEKGIIGSGKFNINKIENYTRRSDNTIWKIVSIKDPDRDFDKLFGTKNKIKEKVEELKGLLDEVEKKLPSSAKTLVGTMRELSDKLLLKEEGYHFYRNEDWNEVRFEILSSKINIRDNEDYEKMNTIIQEYTKNSFGFLLDSDQTKFKAYMDNIAQGITALTSISNMTQQELQIATQYYNSLLGLQKSAFDSLNKTMQTILNNIR